MARRRPRKLKGWAETRYNGFLPLPPGTRAVRVRKNSIDFLTVGKKKSRKNIFAGFYDEDGIFHPIRASADYSASRAGEGGRKRKRKH